MVLVTFRMHTFDTNAITNFKICETLGLELIQIILKVTQCQTFWWLSELSWQFAVINARFLLHGTAHLDSTQLALFWISIQKGYGYCLLLFL